MKKKVLFALIALFSFVGAWAQTGDKVGTLNGYDVYLSQKLVAVSSGTPTAPTVSVYNGATKVTTGVTIDDGVYRWDTTNGYTLYEGELTFGNYYKKVSVINNGSRKSAYVPFQVGTISTQYDFIHDETSWNNSYNATNGALGGLQHYYNANPDEDRWNSEAQRWAQEGDKVGGSWPEYCQHSWLGAQDAPNALYPWIVPYFVEVEGSYKLAFSYPGYPVCYPWGNTTFGNGTGDRVRGCASIPEELGVAAGTNEWRPTNATLTEEQLSAYPFAQRPVWQTVENQRSIASYTYPNGTFDIAQFKMILTPATDPQAMEASNDPKDIADDDVIKSIPAKIIYGSTINSEVSLTYNGVPLVAGTDYTITTVDKDAATYSDNIGTKTITITGAGAYTGTVSQDFEVAQYNLTISAAQVYKTYGQADPTQPDFTVDYNSDQTELTAAQKAHILSFLEFQRYSNEGNSEANKENAGDHDYIIVKKANMDAECNYKVTVQNNTSILYIRKAPVTLTVTNYYKEFNTADPETFTYTATGLPTGKTVDDVKATVSRTAGDAVNGYMSEDAQHNPIAVKNTTEGTPTYAFAGTSKNYDITFANEFIIVPSTATGNVTVIVEHSKDQSPTEKTSDYVYKGSKYAEDIAGDVVVTDNGTVVDPANYEITAWGDATHDNIHVGKGIVKVTLKGNYVQTTVTGEFNITKAPLTITANSYENVDPAGAQPEYGWSYSGFVGNDSYADNQPTEGKVKAKGFKAPTGVTKTAIAGAAGAYTLTVNEDAEADDYAITYEAGAQAYKETILHVYAGNDSKTYGTADPAWETWDNVTVTDANNQPTSAAPLTIGGEKVYTISREAGEDVRNYAINFDGPSVLPGNYIVKYHSGTFTINRAAYYIVAQNVTKTYGDYDPTTWTLFVATRSGEGTTASPYTYTAVEGISVPNNVRGYRQVYWGHEDAGTHEILVQRRYNGNNWGAFENWAQGNYTFTSANGTLTIAKAQLTLTVVDASKTYGTRDPEFSVTPETFGAGQYAGQENVNYNAFTISREPGENVGGGTNADGTYPMTVSLNKTQGGVEIPLGDASYSTTNQYNNNPFRNYDVTFVPGKFTINPVALKVIAQDQAINYGQAIDPYNMIITGFNDNKPVNGETVLVRFEGETGTEATEVKVKDVIYLSTEVTKVGANKNAYTPNIVEGVKNYTLDKENDFTNAWLTIAQLEEIPLGAADLAALLVDALPEKANLKQVLEDHKGLTVDVRMPSERQFRENQWYTLVLPFDIRVRDLSNALGYASVDLMNVANSKGGNLSLELFNQTIKANTPFIVQVDEKIAAGKANGQMGNIVFKNVTISTKNGNGADMNYVETDPFVQDAALNTFTGVYNGKDNVLTTEYAIAEGPDEPVIVDGKDARGQFYHGYTNDREWSLFQTEAYWTPVAGSEANVRISIEEPDGTTTVINGVDADAEAVAAEGWYTINGVKLEGEPTTTGTYIFNGKKVFIQK